MEGNFPEWKCLRAIGDRRCKDVDRISYFLRREEDRKGGRGERKRGKGGGVQTDLGRRGGDTVGTKKKLELLP